MHVCCAPMNLRPCPYTDVRLRGQPTPTVHSVRSSSVGISWQLEFVPGVPFYLPRAVTRGTIYAGYGGAGREVHAPGSVEPMASGDGQAADRGGGGVRVGRGYTFGAARHREGGGGEGAGEEAKVGASEGRAGTEGRVLEMEGRVMELMEKVAQKGAGGHGKGSA